MARKKTTQTDQDSISDKSNDLKENAQGCGTLIVILIVVMIIYGYCSSDKSKEVSRSPQETSFYEDSQTDVGRLRGVWYDEDLSLRLGRKTGYKFISANGKLFVAPCVPSEENLQRGATTKLDPLATELVINRTQFTNANNPNEYYIVDEEEDLLIYDEAGLIVKCKRIFYDDKP